MERTVILMHYFIYRLLGVELYSFPKHSLRLIFATNSFRYQYSWCFQRYAVITADSPQQSEDLKRKARPEARGERPKLNYEYKKKSLPVYKTDKLR